MFVVYDNHKPAVLKTTGNWSCYRYATFEEAEAYAIDWLGEYYNPAKKFELNVPWVYYTDTEYGDSFVIIKEE